METKMRLTLVIVIVALSLLLALAIPVLVPAVLAVNSHSVNCDTDACTWHAITCNGEAACECPRPVACGLPLSGKSSLLANGTTVYNWYFWATGANETYYLCYFQTNWTLGDGTGIFRMPQMGDENVHCQSVGS